MTQYLAGTHTINYGTTPITFELLYTEREDLAIHVYPDGAVVVEAPVNSDQASIDSKVSKRAKWIVQQQRTFQEYATVEPNRLYVSGETHYYLGRRYRLKLIQSDVQRVRFSRGRITLETPTPDDWQHKHKQMQNWYRARAKFIFRKRLEACHPRFDALGIPMPELQIRSMKSRWGSCTPAGKIILNLQLIKVPKKLIDYVIIHELCHLKEHNHGRAFYDLLGRMLPDWETLRQELNQFGFD